MDSCECFPLQVYEQNYHIVDARTGNPVRSDVLAGYLVELADELLLVNEGENRVKGVIPVLILFLRGDLLGLSIRELVESGMTPILVLTSEELAMRRGKCIQIEDNKVYYSWNI